MALFYLLKNKHDALLLLDEPETYFNDKWKREIVDIIDNAMGESASEVFISTHSAIVLTDAMSHEVNISGLATNLLAAIKASQPSRIDWSFDTQDVALALKQIKKFAVFYAVQTPINLEAVTSAFIDHTGPGYFRVELMRAWRKLTENQSHAS